MERPSEQAQSQKGILHISFPNLPESFVKNKPRLSGKSTFQSWILMVLGLIVTPFIFLFSYVLWAVPFYAVIFLALGVFLFAPGCLGWLLLLLISILILFLLILFLPFIISLPIGYIEAFFARIGKCRSPVVGAVMGGLAGFTGSAGFILVIAALSSVPGDELPVVLLTSGIVGLIFSIGGAMGGYWGIKQGMFCEKCGKWYGKWNTHTGFGIEALEPLAQIINELWIGDSRSRLASKGKEYRFVPLAKDQRPALIIQYRKCQHCADADVQWQAYLLQTDGEQKNKYLRFISKGILFPLSVVAVEKDTLRNMTQKHRIFQVLPKLLNELEISSDWFNVMLPAETSHKLEQKIFSTPTLVTANQLPPPIPAAPTSPASAKEEIS